MCLACQKQLGDRAFSSHPVFPSLTYQLALEHQETAASEDHKKRWIELSERAEQALLKQLQTPVSQTGIPSCDVILPIHGMSPRIGEVIDSVLQQVGAVPILHLVGSVESPEVEKYSERWNVQIHRWDRQLTWPQTMATLSPHLRTGFVAIQDSLRPNAATHLAQAIRDLLDEGAELFIYQSDFRSRDSVSINANSLVIRRATLIDMDELPVTATVSNFVELAIRQGRKIVWGQDLFDEHPTQLEAVAFSQPAWTLPRTVNVRRKVHCDVVLPFHGQLEYVREALQSLLHQDQAHATIHLIDDATPGDISDFLNEWAQHPQLRVYRNRENIGQFTSFNNVSRYWETDLVAVQTRTMSACPIGWPGLPRCSTAREPTTLAQLSRPLGTSR